MTKKTGLIAASVISLLIIAAPVLASANALNRQLDIGMSGSDVSALQTFLAGDANVYPQGLITGYFGTLTSAAVSNFQTLNGIASVGRVGPQTLSVLNLQMGNGGVSGATAPTISSVTTNASQNSATVNWNTDQASKGVVYYSNSPLTLYERTNSVDVSGNTVMTDTNYRTAQSVALSNLQGHTTYYYLVYTTDQAGNVSVTWPATFQTI